MRGFEDVNLPVLEIQRGNDQALSRVAEFSIAELVGENLPETLRIVLCETNVPKEKEHPVAGEDLVTEGLVEGQDLPSTESEREGEGDDAASGRAGDEVEVVRNRMGQSLFDGGEKRGGKRAPDPSAVDREDAPSLVHAAT